MKHLCKTCGYLFSNRANNFTRHQKSCTGIFNRNEKTTFKKCKHCLEIFDLSNKPKGWLGNHSRWCDKNPKKSDYINNAKTTSIPAMNESRKKSGYNNQFEKARKLGVEIPASSNKGKNIEGRPHTNETKSKLSFLRTQYLINNPEKHPWKNSEKFKSKPCENFKSFLRENNIEFIEELSPLEERHFSIDIAFPALNVGIEINGNQHYDRNGNLLDYYYDRQNLIEEKGWKLYQFHYNRFFSIKSMILVLNEISELKNIVAELPGFEPGLKV